MFCLNLYRVIDVLNVVCSSTSAEKRCAVSMEPMMRCMMRIGYFHRILGWEWRHKRRTLLLFQICGYHLVVKPSSGEASQTTHTSSYLEPSKTPPKCKCDRNEDKLTESHLRCSLLLSGEMDSKYECTSNLPCHTRGTAPKWQIGR